MKDRIVYDYGAHIFGAYFKFSASVFGSHRVGKMSRQCSFEVAVIASGSSDDSKSTNVLDADFAFYLFRIQSLVVLKTKIEKSDWCRI